MSPSRHQQLLDAHWRYDANQGRYAAPGSPTDGTERWYNLDAAWQAYQTALATGHEPPKTSDKAAPRDPRRQEPQ